MSRRPPAQGPKFVGYFWPVIEILKELGGSARPAEARGRIAAKFDISEAAQAETLPSGFPRFDNQVAWARFYLAKAGIELVDGEKIVAMVEALELGLTATRSYMVNEEFFAQFRS